MRFRTSTIIVAAAFVAYAVFLALEFTGVIGKGPGKLSAGMLVMLLLLFVVLVGDISRSRAAKGDR